MQSRVAIPATLPRISMALLLLASTSAGAAEEGGGMPGDWLTRFHSARSVGIGGSMVAMGEEPLSAFWNPAGLSFAYRNEAQFETARLIEETSVNAASLMIPGSGLPSLGFSILSLRSGDIQRTSDLNEPLGTFNESEMAFLVSASKHLNPGLALGVNVKFVRQSLEEFGDVGYGADLGLLYDLSPRVRIGASVLNLGGPSLTLRETDESFPTEYRAGAMFRGFADRGVLSLELDHRKGTGAEMRSGAEYWMHRSMALRVGYDASEPTGGVSFRPADNMQVDYGIADHELGVMHRVGFSYRFGGFYARSTASPTVFSPLGERPVTRLQLQTRTKAETDTWTLRLVDKFDNLIRQYSGQGTPPAHVVWDGKDTNGLPLPDGSYRFQLSVRDTEGREVEGSPGTVEIDTSGPRGAETEIEIG